MRRYKRAARNGYASELADLKSGQCRNRMRYRMERDS